MALWMLPVVSAKAEVIGRWNSSGAVPLAGTYAATEAHAYALVGPLTASSNLLRTGSAPAANTFAAAGYSGVDSNAALAAGHYWETVIQAATNHAVSYDSIVYRFRRTSSGPPWAQWAYSPDGTNWTWVTPPASNSIAYLDKELALDSVPGLQSVAGPVWFRLYAWGGSAVNTAWGAFGQNTDVLTFHGRVEPGHPQVVFNPSGGQTVGVSNELILAVDVTPPGSGVESWSLVPEAEGIASLTNGLFSFVPADGDEAKNFLLSVVATNEDESATGTVWIAVTSSDVPDTVLDFESNTDSIVTYVAGTSTVNGISFVHQGMMVRQTLSDQKHGNFSARFRHQDGESAFFRNEAPFDWPIAKISFWYGNYATDDATTFKVQTSTDGNAWVDVGPLFDPEGLAFVEAMLDEIPANSHYFRVVSVSGADRRFNVDDIGIYWGEPVLTLGMDRTNGFVVRQGTPITISATAGFGTEPYSYSWTSTLDAVHYDANADEFTILATAPTGEYSATVVAQDAVMRSATNTISFRILPAYAIVIAPPTHGTVATVPPGASVEGETVSILATPDDGFAMGSISVVDSASQPVGLVGSAFTMPASEVTVAVSFVPKHAIEIVPPVNGTVTTTPGSEAVEGATVTVHAVPSVGYQLESIVVHDADLNPVSVVDGTFTMPPTSVIITAQFCSLPPIAEPGALRVQNFNNWTGSVFEADGIHVRDGWMVQNASIAPTSGAFATPAMRLSPTNSAIVSPRFANGIGQVNFWARTWEAGTAAYLLMQSSIDGGSTWSNCASFAVTTAAVHSAWLHITNDDAAVRLVFDPGQSSQDVLIDNVDVCVPSSYLVQNFDGWPLKSTYISGTDCYQGWFVSNCIVNSTYANNGQAARLYNSTGSFIRSPELPNGMGEINFLIRKYLVSDPALTLQIQVSSDGSSWQVATNLMATTTEYRRVSFYLGESRPRFVRLVNSSGAARILIDDICISALRPRPEIAVVQGMDPPLPLEDQPVSLLAQIQSLNGAEVLSVTGYYRIGEANWVAVPMPSSGHGFYAAPSSVPGQSVHSLLRSYVSVQYAGAGAVPSSIGYATNWATSAICTNGFGTQAFSRVRMLGDIIGTNESPLGMTRITNTALWELEFSVVAATNVYLRFITDLEDVFWGGEEEAPVLPLPTTGMLMAGSTNFVRVAVEEPGLYIVRFNHLTGEFSFRRQNTDGYYASAFGLSGVNLRQALREIISTASVVPYESLHSVFASTDVRPDGTVWDMYSDNPGGARPYEYTFDSCAQCGTCEREGDCYRIGNAWPDSWEEAPFGVDLHTAFPVDGWVDNMRYTSPLGEVARPEIVFLNGGKVGMCVAPGYSDRVFEPIDEYKGDLARAVFYASTRYFGKDFGWWTHPATLGADLKPWLAEMLLRWHENDPVSAKELARNEAAFALQGNRNPFIDHPEWVQEIWGNVTNRELPSLRVDSPAALLSNVDEESLTLRGRVSASTMGHLIWSNQTSGISGTCGLAGTNFVLAGLPLVYGQNLIHLVASNAMGQVAGRSLSVFRRSGVSESFNTDAKWQGVSDCSGSTIGELQYRPAAPADPEGYFEGTQVARVRSVGMDLPGYSWRLDSQSMFRYRTPLPVNRFSLFLAFYGYSRYGFVIFVSTNSGESYETLYLGVDDWFEGQGRFKQYESPPLELCPEPGREVFIEIRGMGFEIFLDNFDCLADVDGDELPDSWEIAYFGNITTADGAGDYDGDRLTDLQEYHLDTNPTLKDTDGDGLTDLQETRYGTNPLVADTDGDGLSDGQERTFGTYPWLWDTDGDGQSDGEEYIAGTDALDQLNQFVFDEANAETAGAGELILNWNTVSGRVYRLFRSAHADGDWNGAEPLLQIPGDGQRKQFTNDSPDQTGFFRLTVEKP